VKLWLGISPERSGVFSAGNGPAMRSAVLGVAISDLTQLREFVLASTQITHTDPKAFHGAMAVAIAARCSAANESSASFFAQLHTALSGDGADELLDLLHRATKSVEANASTIEFAESIGCAKGVSGYIYQTVPVAIHAWLKHPTAYADAVKDAITCGGDTDTVAAIVGGIVSARCGVDGIPIEWRDGLLEWPRTQAWIAKLANALASSRTAPVPPPRVGPTVVIRNLLFALIVFAHIGRRALPPY
jgi:ADP-ribosyl-[dinitrogen reductase] hydrolase